MRILRSLTLVLAGAFAAGCTDLYGPDLVCTAQLVVGLRVQVLDASSGAPLAGDATVQARAGSYVETLQPVPTFAPGSPPAYIGLHERPGRYQVTVSSAGYISRTLEGVEVRLANRCHVATTDLTVSLTAAP